ncbi:chemotaxis response regulator protein-glutamate methylesterase [bacterium]|nr:chemotaxis response regulator protein-glutamate methylesterase [bacterium]
MKPIKVLIIDDSQLIRQLLTEIFSQAENIEVVGTAADPFEARDKIKLLQPDVLTLDIEMPRMDGITFLRNIMRLRPMPVIMISTLTEKGANVTLEALELGAIDYIAKPRMRTSDEFPALAEEIISKVRLAAKSNMSAYDSNAALRKELLEQTDPITSGSLNHKIKIIAIGASTGGTEATKNLLCTLPDSMPPIVIAQHMPPGFTASYANRLNELSKLTVIEFKENQPLKKNTVYVANGAQHLAIKKRGNDFYGECDDGPEVNRHKPSVDVLFHSIAEIAGEDSIAVLLTGMGIDGAEGMLAMKDKKATTIVQDEASSVVWGMPRTAYEQGAAKLIMPPDKIGKFLVTKCYG